MPVAVPPVAAASARATEALRKGFARPGPVGDFFRKIALALPEPATLSESNGASLACPHHGGTTYTLLEATAARAPVETGDDLAALCPWVRHVDECVRHVALVTAVKKTGFDRNLLVIPSMDDQEHHLHHAIVLALKAELDRTKADYDGDVFAGLHLAIAADDFARLAHGTWSEDAEHRSVLDEVHIDQKRILVTGKHTDHDPKRDDYTHTTAIDTITVSADQQFVVTGKWTVESNNHGYVGPRQPASRDLVFWPVHDDILWFKNGPHPYWKKLRRVA